MLKNMKRFKRLKRTTTSKRKAKLQNQHPLRFRLLDNFVHLRDGAIHVYHIRERMDYVNFIQLFEDFFRNFYIFASHDSKISSNVSSIRMRIIRDSLGYSICFLCLIVCDKSNGNI